MVTGDGDSMAKNWQWITYDGVKWYVNEYDKDQAFGGQFTGMYTSSVPSSGWFSGSGSHHPIGLVISLYKSDIVSRWKEMWGNIISSKTILGLIVDWLDRIGTANFKKEYEKWPDSPCNRDDGVDRVHWKRTNKWKNYVEVDYDNSKTYQVGEKCYYGFDWVFEFECISESTGNAPLTIEYSVYPKT